MDKGPELVGHALAETAGETQGIFISPGQVGGNGIIESFQGKIPAECPGVNQSYALKRAKRFIGILENRYNTSRPHSALRR